MNITNQKLSSKERVALALSLQEADRIPKTDLFWPETIPEWRRQGMPDVDVDDYFGLDIRGWGGIDAGGDGSPHRVVEETEETVTYLDGSGAILKYWKSKSGTPEHIGFTVDCPDKWRELKPKMLAVPIGRRATLESTAEFAARCHRADRWFAWEGNECFETAKDIVGHETLCIAMAQQPDWAAEMFETATDILLTAFDYYHENGVVFDGAWIHGDLGYNHGPFFSPRMYRELLKPQHIRLVAWFKDRGLPVIFHSDGDFRALIPEMIETGIDCFQSLEAKANIDVRELKAKYGHQVAFMGNINVIKMLTNDLDIIEEEIAGKIPIAMQGGGYIYHSDHSIPPEVTWETYQGIMGLVDKYGQY